MGKEIDIVGLLHHELVELRCQCFCNYTYSIINFSAETKPSIHFYIAVEKRFAFKITSIYKHKQYMICLQSKRSKTIVQSLIIKVRHIALATFLFSIIRVFFFWFVFNILHSCFRFFNVFQTNKINNFTKYMEFM